MDVSGSWHRMYSVCVNVYGKSWVFILISARHDPSDVQSLLGYLSLYAWTHIILISPTEKQKLLWWRDISQVSHIIQQQQQQ